MFLIFVLTITKSKRRNWKTKVNCQKFAPILSQNACTWHELVDLTFCGQSTNWHDLSQNGLKHVTDDWHAKFPTFISRVITANIVMSEMRLNIVDCGYFQIQAEFCAFLEVEHLYRSVGCARCKRQCLPAPQNPRSYRWMLVCEWMGYLRSTCGICFLKNWVWITEYQNQPKRAHGKPV